MRFEKTTIAPQPLVRLAAGKLVVEFFREHDRWRHEVRASNGDVWRSVEGASDSGGDPRWPRSPALIEVSLQEIAGKPAVLGVGLAGRSHYSLCVTAHPDLADTLLFEAACRIQEPVAWLGSTYEASTGDLVCLEPPPPLPPPRATVCWNYVCGPDGLRAFARGPGGAGGT